MRNAFSYLARTRVFDRIVALDDFNVELAAMIREHLRIPGMGETTIENLVDGLGRPARGIADRFGGHQHDRPALPLAFAQELMALFVAGQAQHCHGVSASITTKTGLIQPEMESGHSAPPAVSSSGSAVR